MSKALEKIKQIADQMPNSPEKERGLQAYENLKMFETIADSFERLINPACPIIRKDMKDVLQA